MEMVVKIDSEAFLTSLKDMMRQLQAWVHTTYVAHWYTSISRYSHTYGSRCIDLTKGSQTSSNCKVDATADEL